MTSHFWWWWHSHGRQCSRGTAMRIRGRPPGLGENGTLRAVGGGLGEQQPACHDACSPAYTILIGLHSRKYPLNCYYISGWKPNFECFKWRTEVIQVGLLFHSTVSPLYTNPQVVNFQRCKHAFFQPQSVSLVAQSCPTLCNPMDCNTSGLPVHHQLLELA